MGLLHQNSHFCLTFYSILFTLQVLYCFSHTEAQLYRAWLREGQDTNYAEKKLSKYYSWSVICLRDWLTIVHFCATVQGPLSKDSRIYVQKLTN